tara:strand:- start:205 stop:354 length:150 start_codon:yes stop_codon:yes gene_type:complete
MSNEITALLNKNGKKYYKGECPETGEIRYSFSSDFEDYWYEDEQDLYGE